MWAEHSGIFRSARNVCGIRWALEVERGLSAWLVEQAETVAVASTTVLAFALSRQKAPRRQVDPGQWLFWTGLISRFHTRDLSPSKSENSVTGEIIFARIWFKKGSYPQTLRGPLPTETGHDPKPPVVVENMSFASPGLEEREAHRVSAGPGAPEEPVPCLRLYTDKLLVDVSEGYADRYEEMEAPVIALSFDYAGTRVTASDPLDRVFCGGKGRHRILPRDRVFESQARCLIESFGAVDLSCLDEYAAVPGSEAEYMVQVDGDVHAVCSFSAYAVPQLRKLGWRVEIDEGYKWQVVEDKSSWYADLAREEEEGDWFSLELGVKVGEERLNLLPALLEHLEKSHASSLEGLVRSFQRCVALPVSKNRYFTVPTERFKVVMQVLLELYQGDSGAQERLQFPAVQAASLAPLDEAFEAEGLTWTGETHLQEHAASLVARPEATAYMAPQGLQATLRPYQREGLGFLQHMRAHDANGILADDMGLGKTLQTIAHLLAERVSGRMRHPALVIAPTSLVGNWQREIAKFAPALRTLVLHGAQRQKHFHKVAGKVVVITTYPCLARDIDELADKPFHIVVLDEAQTIKNPRSQAHRAVKRLQAEHRLCLSGTPVENNLEELWSLFDFLMPGLLGDAQRFRTQFRTPIERDGKAATLEVLRERVQPFILRRRKEEVAKELPPKTEIVRPVTLSGAQRELYESIRVAAHDRVRRVIRAKGIAGSTIALLDALMKLRQVCCDPRLVKVRSARNIEDSAKYEFFFEQLPGLLGQGRRVLVFSQFTSMLSLLGEGLRERDIGYRVLTGGTRNRQREIDAFEEGEADVFLLSLKAAGTGLNLTSADTVIHYDPWWNPAAQAQATDRAYRIGQTRPVFVYNLIVAGSVEEQMLKLQRRKQELATSIIEQGGAGGLDLTSADVDGLFAPLK